MKRMKKMNRVVILLATSLLIGHVQAQVPEEKSIALCTKVSATTCGLCGSWGWELPSQLGNNATIIGDFLFLSLYVGEGSMGNADFVNSTSVDLAMAFGFSGTPTFHVNGKDPAATAEVLSQSIAEFVATPPVASTAATYAISGNVITVNAKAKFWKDTEGDYLMVAYLVEDGALNFQNGQGEGKVPHKAVLRASMPQFTFGERLALGAIQAGQEYDKTFTYTITDPKWDKEKMKIYTIIWKKEGTKFGYVNGSSTGSSGATAILNNVGKGEVKVYPNPAAGKVIACISAEQPGTILLQVTDILGRVVYTQSVNRTSGEERMVIPMDEFPVGTYNVVVHLGSGSRIVRQFSVLR